MVPSPGTSGVPGQGSMARRAGYWFRTASSPAKLRAAAAATVLLAIVLSLGGWYSVQRRSTAIDDAAASAQQLIRVQDVRVLVVEADSLASRAYLSGGQEDATQRAAYEDRASAAATGLVEAATASTSGDAALLEDASAQLGTYVGLVEQARANNRQGYPVGAAYQRQARTVSVAVVDDLRQIEANARERVDASIARAHRSSWLLVLATVLLLAAIAAGGGWVALRWRRLINVPLAVAGLVVLVVLTGGVGVNAAAMNDADAVVESSLAAADVLAQARAAAFDARSNEALTLIYRGNGAAFDTASKLSQSITASALDESCSSYDEGCDEVAPFEQYMAGYAAVRTLDAKEGAWDAAVELSTTGAIDPATDAEAVGRVAIVDPVTPFEEFAAASAATIENRSVAAAQGFDDATSNLGLLAVLIVIAGLLIAVLAVFGYGQRLKEYR